MISDDELDQQHSFKGGLLSDHEKPLSLGNESARDSQNQGRQADRQEIVEEAKVAHVEVVRVQQDGRREQRQDGGRQLHEAEQEEEVKAIDDQADGRDDWSEGSFDEADLQESQAKYVHWSQVEEANARGVSRSLLTNVRPAGLARRQ